ncbi:MAG: molybdopterin-dependent oxidoreductase [Mycobacterium sp.]|nr:molybdopterin-dependent oxidoreductase [Mycobacterium sp.]
MVLIVEHKATFCRICEPLCGMIATVEDGRLVALRPDKAHPLSAGFACPKGIAFSDVVNDEGRVTTPLRRGPDGFEPVDWDTALDDIAARLAAIHRRDGSGAIGWYFGNPAAFSYSHLLAVFPFVKGLGRRTHLFTSCSQDTSNRLLASQLLYGAPLSVPIPDLPRTELLIMMGSNPVVSHGSFLTTPRIKDRMSDIVKRGGRVVIVDPRRTETAAALEGPELMVGLDLYVNETTAHCDYVLPVTTMYERDDFALVFQNFQTTPFRQASEAVVAPYGQCRSEWDIIAGLTGRLWRRTPMLAVLANRVGGVNVNRLNSTDIADIEPLAGMSRLSGVPVRVEPA